jgi:hypothetical protein
MHPIVPAKQNVEELSVKTAVIYNWLIKCFSDNDYWILRWAYG